MKFLHLVIWEENCFYHSDANIIRNVPTLPTFNLWGRWVVNYLVISVLFTYYLLQLQLSQKLIYSLIKGTSIALYVWYPMYVICSVVIGSTCLVSVWFIEEWHFLLLCDLKRAFQFCVHRFVSKQTELLHQLHLQPSTRGST